MFVFVVSFARFPLESIHAFWEYDWDHVRKSRPTHRHWYLGWGTAKVEPGNLKFSIEKILNLGDKIHTKFTIVFFLSRLGLRPSCGITTHKRKMTILEFVWQKYGEFKNVLIVQLREREIMILLVAKMCKSCCSNRKWLPYLIRDYSSIYGASLQFYLNTFVIFT